jgi:phenylalanyl-tRNA synthetase beta chain
MKASLNWLKQYIDLSDFSADQISEMLTDLGLEVEGMEAFESIKGGLEGVVVGEVKTCISHPNADKLSLTTVDVGSGELLSIVCGAPNVAAGQKVLVATVGTTLYPVSGDEFFIKESKIRGELSQGMICAQDELGLGEDHSGIMVLPADTPVGMAGSDYLKIERDVVYEIGLTPNRSDATNHIGIARDLAATLIINQGKNAKVSWPEIESFKVANHDLPIDVNVENTEACPRYSGVCIKGVKVGDSPEWLRNRLNAIGVRPINNIVDITNFVLHEMGQPLHAFDYDQISGNKVIVKTLPQGTKFLALDETEKELLDTDLMICDGDSKSMCIGGVFGGLNSGVTENTTNIFLESAHFDPIYIRKSKTHHNLHTDAAFVFEKGSDPNITLTALKRAVLLIQELAGGEIASEVVDLYPNPVQPISIDVTYKNINRLIGIEIAPDTVHKILTAMEMEIADKSDVGFTVKVPTNKADVLREADIIEEVLRVYGLNNVPMPSQIRSSMVIGEKPDPIVVRNMIADLLTSKGCNEMMALSLSESKYYESLLPIPKEALVFINNTSNVQLDVMRPSMLFSGLEAVVRNQNRQNPDVKLYEFGKTYKNKGENKFDETQHLTLFITGSRYPENWHQKEVDTDYFTLKAFVETILNRLGANNYQETALSEHEVFGYGMHFHRGDQSLVEFGKVKPSILKKMDIKNPVFYADFNWDNVLKAIKKVSTRFAELNRYPGTRRDLALVVGQAIQFNEIAAIARKTDKKLLTGVNLFDVFEDAEKLGEGKKSYAVSFDFEDNEKTISDKAVDKIMQKLIHEYENKLGAVIRR